MTAQGPRDQAPRVVSMGCRLNTYEGEVMRAHARDAGLANAIIVNTCAVTKEAERQGLQTLRKLRRENPSEGYSSGSDAETRSRVGNSQATS